ncbi:MAG: ABC transporter permease subunit [Ruminococcus sp.]|nr:ABC transporter permease subunit [Ruminococcus sp.]
MGAVFKRELKSYFTSPVGYVFLTLFYAYAGLMFYVTSLSEGKTRMDMLFSSLVIVLVVIVPILTMRTMAEEKRSKTDQCLLTSPVSITGIVAGKFLAAFVVYLAAIAITVIMALITAVYSAPDWKVIIGDVTGLALLGAAYVAIGIFCSACTESQAVAAVLSFGVIMFMSFISAIASQLPFEWLTKVADKLAFSERYYAFTYGIFDISNVLYFISAVFVFLFLTVRLTEKRRWS